MTSLLCKWGHHKHDPKKGRGLYGYNCARCNEFVWSRGPYVGPPLHTLDVESEMKSIGRPLSDYKPEL